MPGYKSGNTMNMSKIMQEKHLSSQQGLNF